jgi:hypothetical protein
MTNLKSAVIRKTKIPLLLMKGSRNRTSLTYALLVKMCGLSCSHGGEEYYVMKCGALQSG